MPMTKEQLLIPRYMCTGTPGKPLWEGSPFFHGAVFHGEIYRLMNLEVSGHTDYNFSNMPHLFRPMPWWEGRKIEDMPEYVRLKSKVFKVEKYCISGNEFITDGKKIIKSLANTLPATEQEYNEYKKQKEG